MASHNVSLNGSDTAVLRGAFRRRSGSSGAVGPSPRAPSLAGIRPRDVPQALFSFELLFVLFLSAGRYKGDPRLAWVPIDLTALFWAASVVVGAWLMCCRARISIPSLYITLTMLLFSAWTALSLGWTPGASYAATKAFHIATLATWACVGAACVIAPEPARVSRFFALSAAVAAFMAVEVVITYIVGKPHDVTRVLGGGYIGLGRTIGLAALYMCVFLVWSPRGMLSRGWRLGGLLLLLFALLLVGARGPIISLLVALGAVSLVVVSAPADPWRISRRVKAAVAGVAVLGLLAVAAAFLFEGVFVRTAARFSILATEEGGGSSAGARLWAWHMTLSYLTPGPLAGYGIGSWPLMVIGADTRNYPHNIVLEVLFEVGWIGAVMVGGLVGCALVRLCGLAGRGDAGAVAALLGLAFMFANSMVSGDIPDNRSLFALVGLGALAAAR